MKATTKYYVGIETLAHNIRIHVLDQRGKTSWAGDIEHGDISVFAILLTTLAAPCKITIEGSGNEIEDLVKTLKKFKYVDDVIIANHDKLRSSCIKRFNDEKLNAFRMAELLRLESVQQTAAISTANPARIAARPVFTSSPRPRIVANLLHRINLLEERIKVLTNSQMLQESHNH